MSNVTVTLMKNDTPIKNVKLYLYFEALCRSESEEDTYNLDFNEGDFDQDALKEKVIELIQDKLTRNLTYNNIEFDIYFDEEDLDLRLLGNLKFDLVDTTYGVLEELESCIKSITDEDFARAINSVKKDTTEELYVNSTVESDFKVDQEKLKQVETKEEDKIIKDSSENKFGCDIELDGKDTMLTFHTYVSWDTGEKGYYGQYGSIECYEEEYDTKDYDYVISLDDFTGEFGFINWDELEKQLPRFCDKNGDFDFDLIDDTLTEEEVNIILNATDVEPNKAEDKIQKWAQEKYDSQSEEW